MVAIAFADGTAINCSPSSERMEKIWISPSTADSSNTVVLPTVTDKTPRIISCWDNTTGDAVTASISGQTVTLDAAGGTTNHVILLKYIYV